MMEFYEQCDLCPNLTHKEENQFTLDYCRRVNIPFRCGSCLFPQYRYTLCCPTRGNVYRIYGESK